MQTYLLYITTAGRDEALSIADMLIEKRLAACANIVEHVTSVFHWEGKARQEQEALLLAKTSEAALEAAIEAVKAAHSYDTPCITALPIGGGLPAFLQWIAAETAPDKAGA